VLHDTRCAALGPDPARDAWADFRIDDPAELLRLLVQMRDGCVPVQLSGPQGHALSSQLWSLDEVHGQFVQAVRDGRGAKLKESPELFSGLVWTGARAIELGLADDLGSVDSVAREVIKAEEVVDFTPEESLPDRVARRLGTAMAREVVLELRTPALR